MSSRVPIPAIPRDKPDPRRRTPRACDACRARKTKCDGKIPRCSECRAQGLERCVYSDKKTVRQSKELGSANQRNQEYEKLLRELLLVVDEQYGARITDALEGNDVHIDGQEQHAYERAHSVSSLHSQDAILTVDEDLNRDQKTRATGYHGKTSEVTWLKHLSSDIKQEADELEFFDPQQTSDLPHSSTADASYHLDGPCETATVEGDPFVLPPTRTAEDLISLYFRHVNLALPIIREDLFKRQCSQLYNDGSSMPGKKWLGLFNLILSIGAKLHNMSYREEQIDDSMFFARAQIVNNEDFVTGAHEDLQEVQAQTLMAFYFLITSNINRAWKMIGIASRSGIALGLNLHSTHIFSEQESYNARVNLWWSIFRLDTLLSLMTGRPSGLGENSSMAPLPLEFCSEMLSPNQLSGRAPHNRSIQWTIYLEQDGMATQQALLQSLTPSRSLFQFYLVDMDLITHTIANRVFDNNVFPDGWTDIEKRIAYYNFKMNLWQSGLHPTMQFADDQGRPITGSLSAFQAILAFHFYSARNVLNRPCLNQSRLDKKKEVQFPSSSFGGQTASNCLHASLSLISILPDLPDMDWYFLIAPWWSLLHFLVQALTILLIHLSIEPGTRVSDHENNSEIRDSLPKPDASGTILTAAVKALLWLSSLGKFNQAASRAFDRCYACLKLVAVTKGIILGDIAHGSPFSDSPTSNLPQLESSSKPSTEPSNASTEEPFNFFYNPFASFGSAFDIQGHTANPANAKFEDMLASLMDTAP